MKLIFTDVSLKAAQSLAESTNCGSKSFPILRFQEPRCANDLHGARKSQSVSELQFRDSEHLGC